MRSMPSLQGRPPPSPPSHLAALLPSSLSSSQSPLARIEPKVPLHAMLLCIRVPGRVSPCAMRAMHVSPPPSPLVAPRPPPALLAVVRPPVAAAAPGGAVVTRVIPRAARTQAAESSISQGRGLHGRGGGQRMAKAALTGGRRAAHRGRGSAWAVGGAIPRAGTGHTRGTGSSACARHRLHRRRGRF